MIKIEYSHTNYNNLFRHLTKLLNLKVKDNTGILPASVGDGTIQLINLQNGIQIILFDYMLKEDVIYHRKKTTQNYYIMRIDEVAGENENSKAALFFSDASTEWYYMAPANVRLKTMHILFSKNWLQEILINEPKGEVLISNVLLSSTIYHYEILDSEYKRLLTHITNRTKDSAFEHLIIHNTIMFIIERFFTRHYKKISEEYKPLKASADEMQRLKTVESEILKDFSYTPPNINQLSRMAAMSPSKLKLIFKEVFGMPVYQYYQKHRMQKGKAMLITQKYSVKQVAAELGYTHVKDFSKAFQKHFDQFPDELIN
ncbi:MAG TPA: helix-turn-helix transcriptional regulator [Parafilimonas sp.]|nr:helix-turn-helix transcriptional regulator [Parafilimonas sp.]